MTTFKSPITLQIIEGLPFDTVHQENGKLLSNIAKDEVFLTYEELQELQDPLVCEDIQGIACHRVNDGKSMDFIFDE